MRSLAIALVKNIYSSAIFLYNASIIYRENTRFYAFEVKLSINQKRRFAPSIQVEPLIIKEELKISSLGVVGVVI